MGNRTTRVDAQQTRGKGTLRVDSKPTGATVELDDGRRRSTPATFEHVTAGLHKLIFRKEGYADRPYQVEVLPGQTLRVEISLPRPEPEDDGPHTRPLEAPAIDERIYEFLKSVAQRGATCRYFEAGRSAGLAPNDKELWGRLDDINRYERAAGRPMLSVIVVGSKGLPGRGFFEIAQELRLYTGSLDDEDEKRRFAQQETERVHEYWRTR